MMDYYELKRNWRFIKTYRTLFSRQKPEICIIEKNFKWKKLKLGFLKGLFRPVIFSCSYTQFFLFADDPSLSC